MEFDEVVKTRQSIRKYISKEVTKKELKLIIEAARVAPSAKNRQPWRFYILTDKQKNNIAEMMYEWERNNRHQKTSVKGSADQMKEANKVVMVYRPLYKNKDKNDDYKKPDYLSIGASIENMILECTNMNLGSCWLCDTLYIKEEIDNYLGIENCEHISAVIIGYPKEIPQKREKLDIQELIIN